MIVLDSPDQLDFTALIRRGDSLVCSQGLAEPVALTSRLMEQRAAIGPISLFVGPCFADTFKPAHGDAISLLSYCATGRNAALYTAGMLDIVPTHYSDIPRLFAQGVLACDVALLTLGEPDEQGRFNLGLCNDYVLDAARRARLVIAEVSARVPWVHGVELPPDLRPHIMVRTGREPLSLGERDIANASAAERATAQWASSLIPHGATIEFGMGMLPELVPQALRGHRDLGVHSGVIYNSLVDLIEAGVITNAKKPLDTGVSVAGLLMGSRRLFDFAHRNPAVRLAPATYTHDNAVLRALPSFVAINAAVEVDLSGQINAETFNGKYIGAVGGQLDFVRGANCSRGGRAIMLLPATARNGSVSRIVPSLPDGVVTTPRSDVDAIVTEFGVAEIRGKSLRERIKAILAIAHPKFREDLERSSYALASARKSGRQAHFAAS